FDDSFSGTYILLNSENGSALDLAGYDGRSILAYPLHGGQNQQWEFTPSGEGNIIRNLSSDDRYLTVREVHIGEPVIATPFPVAWNVYKMHTDGEEYAIRIAWAETTFVVGLADQAELVKWSTDQLRQSWKCIPCMPAGPWKAGTYFLVNAMSGTALDLAKGDRRPLVGAPFRGASSQKWDFIHSGSGYMIRNHAEPNRYAMVEDAMRNNAAVIGTTFPASWNVDINEQERTLRVWWPETNYLLHLEVPDWSTPEKTVGLLMPEDGGQRQVWRYIQCA
ncbi:hypothetical protein B0H21DRAFT_749888, partial [Amylocystis lapponica]